MHEWPLLARTAKPVSPALNYRHRGESTIKQASLRQFNQNPVLGKVVPTLPGFTRAQKLMNRDPRFSPITVFRSWSAELDSALSFDSRASFRHNVVVRHF
jgi:hypothetical protein